MNAVTNLSFCSSSPALYPKGERRVECEPVDDTRPTNAVGEGGGVRLFPPSHLMPQKWTTLWGLIWG